MSRPSPAADEATDPPSDEMAVSVAEEVEGKETLAAANVVARAIPHGGRSG
jgi:hypothetical protein